jgi:prefoldin subunit 4
MLAKEEESNAEVTWEDQKMMNTYGRLNAKMHDFEAELKMKQEMINNIQDASNELLLADDDANLKYQVGEVYIDISKDNADQILQKEEEKLKNEVERLQEAIDFIKQTLAQYKVKLYSKFRNAINLEDD